MTRQDILDKLRETMRQSDIRNVKWDAVTVDTTIGELGFDSLSVLDLIYDLQQTFGTDFEAEDLFNVSTVGELAAFLETKLRT